MSVNYNHKFQHTDNLVSKCLLLGLVLSSITCGVNSIRITELNVPKYANLGHSVTLECNFELSRSNLYSVKWYKDDFEFFRYMPGEDPPTTTFKVPGINLNITYSGRNQITINDVSYKSTGVYKCEVSTGGPNFNTSLQAKNMTVLAFTDHPPIISGIQDSYTMTEYILANCTSGKSNPAPRLAWFINGRQADSWAVAESGPISHEGPLFSRQSSLQYPASKITGTKEELIINCTAYVGELPPSSTFIAVRVLSASANQQLSQEWLYNRVQPGDKCGRFSMFSQFKVVPGFTEEEETRLF